MSGRWLMLALALALGCGKKLTFECVEGQPHLNGRKFSCSVCKEEQGCMKSGANEYTCPGWVSQDCSYKSAGGKVCGENCCAGQCITCDACR